MGNELLEPFSFLVCHYRCQNQHGARAADTAQQWPVAAVAAASLHKAGSALRGEEPHCAVLLG